MQTDDMNIGHSDESRNNHDDGVMHAASKLFSMNTDDVVYTACG